MAKLVLQFASDTPVHQVAHQMFSTLADSIRAREAELPTAEDPEVLHEFRTSLRRTRALLRNLRGAIRGKHRQQFQLDLRAIQHTSGLSRDLDVFLDDLPSLWAALPPEYHTHLPAATELVTEWRTEERTNLLTYLNLETTRNTLHRWYQAVNNLANSKSVLLGSQALDAVGPYARRQLGQATVTYFQQDARMTVSTDARDLHRLRIRGKRLRYWMEAFKPVFAAPTATALLATLKRLQDRLGRYNDALTQVELLTEAAKRLDSQWEQLRILPQTTNDADNTHHRTQPAFSLDSNNTRPLDAEQRAGLSAALRYLLETHRVNLLNGWEPAIDGASLLRKPENLHRLRRLIHADQTHPNHLLLG